MSWKFGGRWGLLMCVVVVLGACSTRNDPQYGFWDQNLNTGTVNTSYLTRFIGTERNPISYGQCLFPEGSAHPYLIPCAPDRPRVWPLGNNIDLSWNQNGHFGASRYWVLDINVEPADLTHCLKGPPSLSTNRSEPGHGTMGFSMIKDTPTGETFNRAHLFMEFGQTCPGEGIVTYMSIGAQDNRGNGQSPGLMNPALPTAGSSILYFTAKLWDYVAPLPELGQSAATFRLMFLSQWPNEQGQTVPRMIFVNLFYDGIEDGFIGPILWNWPVQEAMYFPGAEVAYSDIEALHHHCGNIITDAANASPLSSQIKTGQQIQYRVDVAQLYKCFSDHNKFSNPMPSPGSTPLRAVHWAVEGAGTGGGIWASVHGMRMSDR